jgi:cytochrome c oxidase subunit 4
MAEEEEHHPSELEYIKVGVVLAVVTAAEVAVFYVPQLRPLIVWLLLPMMVLKFAMVAMWFMHLRFDNKLFRRLFITGILFALGVYSVVIATLIGQ